MRLFSSIGQAVLTRVVGGAPRQFPGRVLCDEDSGEYRFYVELTPVGDLPEHWPDEVEWTGAFDVLKDVEWFGNKPDGLEAAGLGARHAT